MKKFMLDYIIKEINQQKNLLLIMIKIIKIKVIKKLKIKDQKQ